VKKSRWSPADLDRQRLVVRGIAQRSEVNLRTLAAARTRLVAAVHRQIGVPLALAGCFVAGMLAVPRKPAHPEAGPRQRGTGTLRRVATLLRTVALAVPGYRAAFGAVARAVPPQ
jgi:hypothetical protein